MTLIVSGIVGGVSEHNSIVNSVGVDDWTAKRTTIASNGRLLFFFVGYFRFKYK